jgi:hypothetical protein
MMPLVVLADYMSRAELAAELGICTRTLIRWQQRGEGPPITHVGQRPMYRRASVAAWLARREDRA